MAHFRFLHRHSTSDIIFRGGFDLPRRDFEGYKLPDRKGRDFILWNSDRSEAMLSLSTRYGPLNAAGYDIHVRKLGDEWIVIKLLKLGYHKRQIRH